MIPTRIEIQKAFRDFASINQWHCPYGASLTLKQGRPFENKTGAGYEPLTRELASANMRHFLNRLNQHVFGNAAERHGKRVPVIPVIEGGNGTRLHYHLTIDCPRKDLRAGYPELLDRLWQETPWGYKNNHFQAEIDGGWTKYTSKLRDKPNFADSIDWENLTMTDRRD